MQRRISYRFSSFVVNYYLHIKFLKAVAKFLSSYFYFTRPKWNILGFIVPVILNYAFIILMLEGKFQSVRLLAIVNAHHGCKTFVIFLETKARI